MTCLAVLRALLLLSLLTACPKAAPPAQGPVATYTSFAEALRRGDSARAYAALSPQSRAFVESRARAVADASVGMVKDDPAAMLFQSGVQPVPLSEMQLKLLEEDQTTALLEVTSQGQSERIRLVKADDQWRVDLSHLFPPQVTP